MKYALPISQEEWEESHDGPTFKALYIGGSAEVVSFDAPSDGFWYVTVRGFNPSSGYSLVASWGQ